jgi:hypothetical protein
LDSLAKPTASTLENAAGFEHDVVHTKEAEAIEAVQATLGTNPQGGSATVDARLDTLAVDSDVVHKAGTETIAGIKTFTDNVYANGSSANRYFIANASDTGAERTAGVQFQRRGVIRWIVAKNQTAESGSNAGSDLAINRYDDAGNLLGEALGIVRSTGENRIGETTAGTAHLRLNRSTGNVSIITGTGSPEGVVTAPVGSTYTDTDATGGVIRWTKFTGSGNTGWLADVAAATIGNLLTANQASVETNLTGLSTTNGTVVRTTAWSLQGSASALVTQAASGNYRLFASIPGSSAANAVIRGGTRTVTLSAAVRPVSGTPTGAFLALGTSLRNYTSTAVPVAIGVTTVLKFTVTLPEDEWPLTTDVAINVWVADSTGSGSCYFDALGIWAGAGGDWALPGVPITGTSPTEARSLTGTGFPEGVVTAPVGSMYTDTAATNGAIRWIKATGSGNTGWRVDFGDTGWRVVAAWDASAVFSSGSLPAGWSPRSGLAGSLRVRRIHDHVQFYASHLRVAVANTSDAIWTVPAGFQATSGPLPVTTVTFIDAGSPFPAGIRTTARGQSMSLPLDSFVPDLSTDWPTIDAWPATLPGTAV